MFRNVLALAASLVTFTLSSGAAHAEPSLVPSPVEKVFVPQGFDDNDSTEVVLHGHFPNTCYKVGPVKVERGTDGKSITLEALSYYYGGFGCAQVLVPFVQTAQLGVLNEGMFQIKIKGQPEIPSRGLEIAHAQTQSPDDYLYAPVESASINGEDGEPATLKIEGNYPYMFIGCMMITELRTSITSDNVVVVQPITQIKDDSECPLSKKYSFEKELGALAKAEYLIHVRTLDGNALNRLVDLTAREGR